MAENVAEMPAKGEEKGRLDNLKGQVREKVETIKQKAHEEYEKAAHKLEETLEKVSDTSLKDVHNSLNTYVKENPGKSLMIAAGVGFALGVLVGRRR